MTHLRQAMLEELHRRNYAASTIPYYIQNVERMGSVCTLRCAPLRISARNLNGYAAS